MGIRPVDIYHKFYIDRKMAAQALQEYYLKIGMVVKVDIDNTGHLLLKNAIKRNGLEPIAIITDVNLDMARVNESNDSIEYHKRFSLKLFFPALNHDDAWFNPEDVQVIEDPFDSMRMKDYKKFDPFEERKIHPRQSGKYSSCM